MAPALASSLLQQQTQQWQQPLQPFAWQSSPTQQWAQDPMAFSTLQVGDREQTEMNRVATGVVKVSDLARSSMARADALQQQLNSAVEQLKQAQTVEAGLASER